MAYRGQYNGRQSYGKQNHYGGQNYGKQNFGGQNRSQNYHGDDHNVSVLFEHVFSEEHSEEHGGSRRFVIRVLKIADTRSLSIGLSRQWLTPEGDWIAAKKGHAYLPVKSWNELVACIGGVNDQIKANFENDNGGGRMGSNACGSGVGISYAPNATTITAADTDGDDAIVLDTSVTTASDSFASAPKTTPSSNIFHDSTNKRGGAANVYRRGGVKRGYGQ
jgi:hypothetical protein